MKKGFTLVELLAVMAILALLALITIPVVDSTLDKQRERIYKQNIEAIKDALKNWSNENISFLPGIGEEVDITLEDLKEDGLMERNFKNPKTKKCYANNNKFQIKNVNGVYVYEVNDLTDGTDNECKNPTYVYYQEASVGLVTERPTKYNSYLKYPQADGVLGTPLACNYVNEREFCIRYGNYKLARLKLLEHYGPTSCSYNEDVRQLGCGNDIAGAGAREDGPIFVGDETKNYACNTLSGCSAY